MLTPESIGMPQNDSVESIATEAEETLRLVA